MASQSLLQAADFVERYNPKFVDIIPDRLLCTICETILKNAKQTSCGCKVCDKCISNLLRDGEQLCPGCKEGRLQLGRDIHSDNATNKEIANLRIHCPFTECSFTEILRSMILHVDICEFRRVLCENCFKEYPHKDKELHDRDYCEERIVQCKFCFESMSAKSEKSDHSNCDSLSLCSKYIGDCPNECGSKKVLLKSHLQKCTNQRIVCPFKSYDCKVGKLTKEKLLEHLSEESITHTSTLVNEFMKVKEANRKLLEDVERLQKLMTEQIIITGKLTDSRIKVERSVDELKRKGPMSSVPEKNTQFRNASFIWKISDFESIKAEAESGGRSSVTSDPFYTSEFGYKMCLRVYPAGDGVGRSTHLSVFFAIMRGEYDDLLYWPFKQKVTLSLLDQEMSGSKNHSDTFKPDARSACYQKPMDDCNIASGSPKFISLATLLPHSVYYKNDTIFLKISVDTVGISKP